MKNQVGNTAWS